MPNQYECRYWCGVTLVETGAYAEAAKHLRQAVTMKPQDPWPRIYGGVALAATKDYKSAVEMFREAARICPECFDKVRGATAAYQQAQEQSR
jgi:Flp pilus assembly protein TadD